MYTFDNLGVTGDEYIQIKKNKIGELSVGWEGSVCSYFPVHLHVLPPIRVQHFVPLTQLHSDSRYFSKGVCHVMNVSESNPDTEHLTQRTFLFQPWRSGYKQNRTPLMTVPLVLVVVKFCLMSSDVSWHIRDKWPMPKHGSVNLYVHGNQKAR